MTIGALIAGAMGVIMAPSVTAAPASCSGYVALTFDDGPNAGTTAQILSALRSASATAVAFPTGSTATSNPSLMRAYADAGVQIGNHSWDHPHLVTMSRADVQSQLERTQRAIQQVSGVTPEIFRPPYGERSSTVDQVAAGLGMRVVTWDVDSRDWDNASAAAIRQAASQARDGQVVLMHDWPASTVHALPGILSDLSTRGLCTGHISPSTGRAVAPSGTTPPPTNPPPTTPPPTPPPVGACSAAVSVNQWTGGFVATVRVTAGSAALNGWSVIASLPSGAGVSGTWNSVTSGSSGAVRFSNAPWNGALAAGQSTEFGFQGTGSAAGLTATCGAG